VSPPPRERFDAWYAALNPREQLIVRVGAIAGAVLLVVGIVLRLHGVVQTAEKRVATKRAAVAYIQGVLPELRAAPPPASAGQSLVTVIDRTTRDAGLSANLKGTEPSGTSGVRVRLESASFAQLLLWLLRVQQEYGLSIQAATLEKTDAPGRVNASLTFVRS
jgi:general secretion pathway protein M